MLDDIDKAVDRLIVALENERAKSRKLELELAEERARLARSPEGLDDLSRENERLRRNAQVAAEKIESLIGRL